MITMEELSGVSLDDASNHNRSGMQFPAHSLSHSLNQHPLV